MMVTLDEIDGCAKSNGSLKSLRRWLNFNLVGGLGIVVQLAVLAALTSGAGLNYLLSTALAVETTVLHNFIWHKHWTWRDRGDSNQLDPWKRLVRFQFSNGALSLGGNLLIMQLFVGVCGMNATVANLVSISVCSILNFIAGDRWVFAKSKHD